jgi:chorismate mutase
LHGEKFQNIIKELCKLSTGEKEILLEKIRTEVDKIDAELISLLIKRIKLSGEIGIIKNALNVPAYDAKREKEIENNISSQISDPKIEKSLKRVFERIIDESRAIQKEREK